MGLRMCKKCNGWGYDGVCIKCGADISATVRTAEAIPVITKEQKRILTTLRMKWCNICSSAKMVEAFSRSAAKKDGRCTRCKDCQSQKMKTLLTTPCDQCGQPSWGTLCQVCFKLEVAKKEAERLAQEPMRQHARNIEMAARLVNKIHRACAKK